MSCVLLITRISLVDLTFQGQVGKRRERERGGGGVGDP